MKKNLIVFAAASALMLANSTVLAHSDERLATQKAANGGQQRMAGAYHFELVVIKDSKEAKENPVVVYVTDHAGVKIQTVGAGGTATMLVGKQKVSVKLVPDGDNRLKGVAMYASAADMKVVVSITLSGKTAEQVRFTPLATVSPPAKDGHTGHKH
jgi:hypothetical protein